MDTTMDNAIAMTVQADLAPTQEEVALLTRQYQKALDGLFEAYQFGMMLRAVKERLEAAEAEPAEPLQIAGSLGESARGPTERISTGDCGINPGWRAGTGLKGWLAQFCPEINYSTAKRFLAVAERTVSALALADAEGEVSGERQSVNGLPDAPDGAPNEPSLQASKLPNFPPEAKVREFLAGKSQRSVLRLGGKREGAGRKAKDWAAALEASPEVAWKELAEPLERLSRLIVRERRHAALTPQDLATLRDAIDLLHEVIHADA